MDVRLAVFLAIGLFLGPASARAQKVVYFVRHAEKGPEATDPPLSSTGAKRAKALARILKDADIKVIYTSDTRRTQETAQPLAESRGLKPTVVAGGDPEKTFAKIRAEHPDDAVLVVGHTNTIDKLIQQWDAKAVVKIDEAEFNRILVVVPEAPGKISLARFRYDIDEP
jgi:broad specificity phosphatase PhoE